MNRKKKRVKEKEKKTSRAEPTPNCDKERHLEDGVHVQLS